MKINRTVLLIGWIGAWVATNCPATNVGTSTVVQPINLGAHSDPARIPLGEVGVVSNYNYGILDVISEPRPCPDQPMRWEGGSELDQNLASVFGISVEAGDTGASPKPPVILRLKPWKPPGYSPYTKDQALAATLWCLLQRSGGTPESPLEVQVVTESKDDEPLAKKYSGIYVTRPGKDKMPVPPVKVPGTVLETDARGINWVTFPDEKRKPIAPPPEPGMILFQTDGSDGSEGAFFLLPVWGNGDVGESPLWLNQWSASICYSCFNNTGRSEANQLIHERGSLRLNVDQGENGDSVSMSYPQFSQTTLAADLFALVLTSLPTEDRPLTVRIQLEERQLADYPAFRGASGWTETKTNPTYNYFALECKFVWDPVGRKLLTGSIPLMELAEGSNYVQPIAKAEPARDESDELSKLVLLKINDGIHDGSLIAEKNMADDMLSSHGLQRQLGLAGYYEGLASFCEAKGQTDQPLENPGTSGDRMLAQYHQMGWDIARTRGASVLKASREIIETVKQKKSIENE